MTKRERQDSTQDAVVPKHARVQAEQDASATAQQDGCPLPTKLQGVPFPVKIAALPHIMRQVEEFLLTPDEAMMEAAKAGHVTWVKQLLGRFSCELLDPLQAAAADGHAAVVKVLLAELVEPRRRPDHDTWGAVLDAVEEAGQNQHLAVLQLLLPVLLRTRKHKRKAAAYKTVSTVLEDAAAQGHLPVVKFMVAQATPIYLKVMEEEEDCSLALDRAISGKHLDVVEFLLNLDVNGFLLDLVGAFDAALEVGLHDLADRVYDLYPRTHAGAKMLLELAHCDILGAVKYVLGKGVDLDLVDGAFEQAAMGSAVAVAEFLWASFKFSSEVFDRVVENTATYGWNKSEMMSILYKMKRPSSEVVNRVFGLKDSVSVLKLLLEKEQVPDESIVAAFEHAASGDFKDKFAIIQLLYKRGCIPAQVLTEALVAAATQGYTDVVELLRNDPRILSETLEKAFIDSALSGSGNRMQRLYASRLVSAEVIFRTFVTAITSAQMQNVTNLASYLSVGQHPPRQLKDLALVFAARRGLMQVVETLDKNEKGEWPLNVLQEALEVARNNPIRNYIRTIICNQLFNRDAPGRLAAVMNCLADWSEESKGK